MLLRPAQSVGKQREAKIKAFDNHPVKIIEVRNLQKGEDWFRDLEIEIKNVSDKPIYAISMSVDFPDILAPAPTAQVDGITASRSVTGFPLKFGSIRLLDLRQLATPDDVSLKPGETYVFRIPSERVKGLESMKARMNFSSQDIKKIELQIDKVGFGDGTGFIGPRKRDYKIKKSQHSTEIISQKEYLGRKRASERSLISLARLLLGSL
jgi:hypothetical protein